METTFEIEKIATKQHNQTLRVNGYFLHSKYNPEKEAKQFVEKNYKPNHTTILFGYGMGYFAKEILNIKSEDETLFIIEPLKELNTYIEMPQKVNFIKTTNIEVVKKFLTSEFSMYNNINIICSPNYNHLFPDFYTEFLSFIKERVSVNRVGENTLRKFSGKWQENYIYNLSNAVKDRSLGELYQKFSCPVVIVSGGPSLTKQLEQLKKIKEHIIVIAAGSTINTLLHHNITPDFVISIDGGEANYWHFKNLQLQNTKLIYSMYNHHLIRDSFKDVAYYYLSWDIADMQEHMEKILYCEVPIIIGGGSVANDAFAIGLYISSGPITLIGQDLAYTDNKTHAENNKNFSLVDENYKQKRGIFSTKGYYGDTVHTDYAFYIMKESFENVGEALIDKREIYNSTEGGIFIEGFQQIPFVEFCTKYVDKEFQKDFVQNMDSTQGKAPFENFILHMKQENKAYDKIKAILKESLKILLQSQKNLSFSPKLLKKLDKNDKQMEKFFKEVAMYSIFAPITMDVMKKFSPKVNETNEERYNRVFLQSKTLYERLLEATDTSQQFTKNLLEKYKVGDE